MRKKPPYFEPIRRKAAGQWDRLEAEPEIAAPWHQLFKQVQSPRHIVSELLQNADDAGATEAFVRIENQEFVFEHNGEDFVAEHFASLCRFGYSNKRALHTIGFRGIGFKSTFSLGESVVLATPTLAIRFERKRFTEPIWEAEVGDTGGRTRIRVRISDLHRTNEVTKNLDDWFKSPLSLLFFKSIRRVDIGDRAVCWESLRAGPIPDSEWMSLNRREGAAVLVLRSAEEPFPEEALAEIKEERMLGIQEDAEFPPCRVEIVMGEKGRLFVVLPTGVQTELPFACNAPFIQDPARLKIKDPETSPTNRWLLQRAGQLAANAMLSWLAQGDTAVADRAAAYGLLPDVNRDDGSLDGLCGTIVEEAFDAGIAGQQVLLTETGLLTFMKQSVGIPKEVAIVWPPQQAAVFLDHERRPALCQHIRPADRKKLVRWGLVEEVGKEQVLVTLRSNHLPKPASWAQLLSLWTYVAQDITGDWGGTIANSLRILPAQGKDVLYSATELVRLGEKRLLESDADWEFLAHHLIVLNQNWPRFLAEQRRTAAEQKNVSAQRTIEEAYAVLKRLGLDDTNDVNKVFDRIAAAFFAQSPIGLRDCVRLAHIAAKLNISVGTEFRYVTRDKRLRAIGANVLCDEDGRLEEFVPPERQEAGILHGDYLAKYSSCSKEEWVRWVTSGRSGLMTFVPLVVTSTRMYGRPQIEHEARKRGLNGNLSYPYKTQQFVVEDWDFESSYWEHWKAVAASDGNLWSRVVERILSQRDTFWSPAKGARIIQIATTGTRSPIAYEALLPTWVLMLRQLPCLPDTRGFPRKPGDLLRRTPETEALLDVEPFVHGRLDQELNRPLLDRLGVQSSPTGPDGLLERIRALSKSANPPVGEVEKWYRRLDQVIVSCSTNDFQRVVQAFRTEKLVLTADGAWADARTVFLLPNEDEVPGAGIVRESVRDLTIWRKIGVLERATVELAVKWLMTLPSGTVLPPEDARRVRVLLSRHPVLIWQDCGHWLNLAGEWARTVGLSFTLTMQTLIPWAHLHPWIKQKTADLRPLSADVVSARPFSDLHALAGHVEERFHRDPVLTGHPEEKRWLTTVGTELRRVEFDAEDTTQRIRAVAGTLAKTMWHATPGLEVIPYVDGTPAGTPRSADVLWLGDTLYVGHLPRAKLAKRVPEELGKAFGREDIKAALDYSFERSPEDIREYLEENFNLVPRASMAESELDEGATESTDGREEPSGKPESESPGEADASLLCGEGSDEDLIVGTADVRDEVQELDENIAGTALGPDEKAVRRHPVEKPVKPSLMERFAKGLRFRKESDNRFFHEDGSWIGRAEGSPFPWERRTATGELVRCYWPKDHCLELEPLRLDAEIWGLLDELPDTYSLVLSNGEGEAVELTGTELRALCDKKEIVLHPAAYRLVYEHLPPS